MLVNLENAAGATGLEKVNFHSNPKEKSNTKECSNYHTVAPISHASKIMLKTLQARLYQHMNQELTDWGQEKWVTEDEMVGWHHWLNGHEFEQTQGDSEGTVKPGVL